VNGTGLLKRLWMHGMPKRERKIQRTRNSLISSEMREELTPNNALQRKRHSGAALAVVCR